MFYADPPNPLGRRISTKEELCVWNGLEEFKDDENNYSFICESSPTDLKL